MPKTLRQAYEHSRWRCAGSVVARTFKQPHRMFLSKVMLVGTRAMRKALPLHIRTFWGDRMQIVYPDDVSWTLFKYAIYEPAVTGFLVDRLKPGMTFVDVGAHFGYFSMLGSRLVGDEGRIHSFEPTPGTFEILKGNTQGRPNITINNLAMWCEPTTITFNDFGPGFAAYNSAFDPRLNDKNDNAVIPTKRDVTATTVDAYVSEHQLKPDIIKVDAESAEFQVLEGMQQTMADHRPIVVMEIGDFDIDGTKTSRELIDSVIAAGYVAQELTDEGPVEHRPRDHYWYGNIVFTPKAD